MGLRAWVYSILYIRVCSHIIIINEPTTCTFVYLCVPLVIVSTRAQSGPRELLSIVYSSSRAPIHMSVLVNLLGLECID
jgi:hypothetical protein